MGGKNTKWASLFGAPGDQSKPVAGDYAALIEHPGGSRVTAVAFASPDIETVGQNGERYFVGRDSDGVPVSTFHMKNDGDIILRNEKGTFTLKSDGKFRFENDGGYIELASNGKCDINGNFTVDA